MRLPSIGGGCVSKTPALIVDLLSAVEIVEGDFRTLNHWNNPAWLNSICQVHGTGKYRFNFFGSDGFAYTQYRFKSKDEAIQFLCSHQNRLVQVTESNGYQGQYHVRQHYLLA